MNNKIKINNAFMLDSKHVSSNIDFSSMGYYHTEIRYNN